MIREQADAWLVSIGLQDAAELDARKSNSHHGILRVYNLRLRFLHQLEPPRRNICQSFHYNFLLFPPIPDNVSDEQALFVGDILATGYWAATISEIFFEAYTTAHIRECMTRSVRHR